MRFGSRGGGGPFLDGWKSKIKFYVVCVASFLKLNPCVKFDENRLRDVKVEIWRLWWRRFILRWMVSKIKFQLSYVVSFLKLHPRIRFDENRSRDVKVEFWSGGGGPFWGG